MLVAKISNDKYTILDYFESDTVKYIDDKCQVDITDVVNKHLSNKIKKVKQNKKWSYFVLFCTKKCYNMFELFIHNRNR